MKPLPNSAPPWKVYGVYDDGVLVDEITAHDVHQAFDEGRRLHGRRIDTAIRLTDRKRANTPRREPMFES